MLHAVKIQKLNTVLSFDSEKLPAASVNYLIAYGLKQSLNDCHAGVKASDYTDKPDQFLVDVKAEVDRRETQIRTGAVPSSGAVDPLYLAMAQKGWTVEKLMAVINSGPEAATGKSGKAA
jgi:hypothetical protein